MKKHVLKFLIWLIALCTTSLALQTYLPGHVPQLLPAAPEFIPHFLKSRPATQVTEKNPPAEIFVNRDTGLSHFYRKLAGIRNGREKRVRVMHFGDSVIWWERVARDIRRGLIRDFGDGGRGQVYLHEDRAVTLSDTIQQPQSGFDFLSVPYEHFNHFAPKWLPQVGFSGWSYRPVSPAATSVHKLSPNAEPITEITLVLRPPENSAELTTKVRVQNLEKKPAEIAEATLALQKNTCSAHVIPISPTRQLAMNFSGSAYIDAVLLERERGVSYSTFVQKGKHMAWMTAILPDVFACGYRAVRPDLLVFEFGINESASIDWKAMGFTLELYQKQLKEFFARLRLALPDVDVLILGPYERLKKVGDKFESYRAHDDVRRAQMAAAQEFGFAYFDSYAALGGAGHLERMIKEGLAFDDHAHLTDKGSELLGNKIYSEIYAGFAGKQPGAPLSATAAPKTEPAQRTGLAEIIEAAEPSPILFNSFAFAWFFIVVFAIAAFLNRIPIARLVFLTLASWYFYASWRWWALGLMLFSTGIDYYAALEIEKMRMTDRRKKLFWLLVSLVSNLGLLFFFKYFDFFAELMNPFLAKGNFFQIPILKLVLPVGISFYTFQSLSYTIDVYREHMPAEKSFWRFAFFVSFFPQLVAGPIVRATEFIPQMMKSIRHFWPNRDDFGSAVYLFSKGLFKKTLADWISVNYADRVFSDPQMFTAVETLVGVYAFGVQIYLDFSSYTDMAIAAAKLFGFDLTLNFNRPYVATSISDFWRRWHISLSTWLRDYLYISLGGNRRRLYLNLFLTMLLGGLWHGAGINFVLWGIFHGVVLIIERLTGYARWTEKVSSFRPFAILITFHLVMFSWILFRAHDWLTFTGIVDSLRSLTVASPNVDWKIVAAVGIPYLWQFSAEKFHFLLHFLFHNLPAPAQAIAVYIVFICVYRIHIAEAKAFIYFQF